MHELENAKFHLGAEAVDADARITELEEQLKWKDERIGGASG